MDPRVLVAYDPGCDAAILTRQLSRFGYEVVHCHSGTSALDFGCSAHPRGGRDRAWHRRALGAAGRRGAEGAGRPGFRLVGFTVPRAPELEAPALEAGYNHVVLDLGDAAEVLLALGGPAADLVARSQSVFLYWNYTLIEHGFMLVQGARSTADPRKREQHLAAARQVVARVRAYVRDWQDDPRAAALGFRLAFLEGELEDAEGNPR